MYIVEVYLLVPIKQSFSYIHNEKIEAGVRVLVPFGKGSKTRLAMVVSSKDMTSHSNFKRIHQVLDKKPLFNSEVMRLMAFASGYYFTERGKVFSSAMPKKIRDLGGSSSIKEDHYKSLIKDFMSAKYIGLSKSKKQKALMRVLIESGAKTKGQIKQLGFSTAIVKALIDKKLIELEAKPLDSLSTKWTQVDSFFHPLSKIQEQAYESIKSSANKPVLLYGITGSGKTEIYSNLIKDAINEQKQVLVLVPEIGLTPQLVSYFEKRFTCPVITLNSKLADGRRCHNWIMAKEGQAGIVIGTRSAVFTPFKNLGLVIVDEENDHSYKQDNSFSYHGRDMALMRANFEEVPIILGSATPSLESWKLAKDNRYKLVSMLERAVKGAIPPKIALLDTKDKPMDRGICSATINHIERHVNLGGQVLVYLGRRGFSPLLQCDCCGWLKKCKPCDKPMVLHKATTRLHCHICTSSAKYPNECPVCFSKNLITGGIGTEQVEETLSGLLPRLKVVRVDSDSVSRKGSLEKIIEDTEQHKNHVLIGTQLLSKGHDFSNITLVVILQADFVLYSSDFRAKENLAQLLHQVSGRSGRKGKKSEVFVQTSHIDDGFLNALVNDSYAKMADNLLEQRKSYPPYKPMAMIHVTDFQHTKCSTSLENLRESIKRTQKHDVAFGPITSASIPKKQGRFDMQLPLYAKSKRDLHLTINENLKTIESIKKFATIHIDIDPLTVA